MISRRDVAIRLGIPLEMAARHGIATRITEQELAKLEADPPAWLLQSRANRTGKAVWVELVCEICGFHETARPKKWWPDFTYLACDFHRTDELPQPVPGRYRREVEGIGTRFIGVVDEKP